MFARLIIVQVNMDKLDETAKLFENTSEIGAAAEFFTSALNAGIARTKPVVYLDRAGILLKLGMWPAAMSDINVFEKAFGPSERSRALRIKAHITTGQFDKAEAELVSIQSDDPERLPLHEHSIYPSERQASC